MRFLILALGAFSLPMTSMAESVPPRKYKVSCEFDQAKFKPEPPRRLLYEYGKTSQPSVGEASDGDRGVYRGRVTAHKRAIVSMCRALATKNTLDKAMESACFKDLLLRCLAKGQDGPNGTKTYGLDGCSCSESSEIIPIPPSSFERLRNLFVPAAPAGSDPVTQ